MDKSTGIESPVIYEKAIATARTEIWQEITSGKAGSASIAILDGGKIVYAEGFGMADREKSIPVDPDTLSTSVRSPRSSRRPPSCCW